MTTEFQSFEKVVALVTTWGAHEQPTDEPIVVGFYPELGEVFLDLEGRRISIGPAYVEALIKQLRRAKRLAEESTND